MDSTATATTTASCPECDAELPLPEGAVVGEVLPCFECSAELELVGLDPLHLELAPEVDEDWGE